MSRSRFTSFLIPIIGATIATVVGGIFVFHYQKLMSPAQTQHTTSEPSVSFQSKIDRASEVTPDASSVVSDKPVVSASGDTTAAPPVAAAVSTQSISSEPKSALCPKDFKMRFDAIANIFSTTSRNDEYAKLVDDLLKCESYDGAMSAAGKIFSTTSRDRTYGKIVNACIAKKEFANARRAIDNVFSTTAKDDLLKSLVSAVN